MNYAQKMSADKGDVQAFDDNVGDGRGSNRTNNLRPP